MRFGGIVFVALLVLGACSSDPVPKEPAATSSAPATPTATPPAMPEQAKQDSPEGAAAFVKHYVDVFNYAASTGDVDELSRLSAATCVPCTKYAARFKDIYAKGDRVSVRLWTLTDGAVEVADDVVTADMKVNEGTMKVYKFRFAVAHMAPHVIEDITILESA